MHQNISPAIQTPYMAAPAYLSLRLEYRQCIQLLLSTPCRMLSIILWNIDGPRLLQTEVSSCDRALCAR